VPFVMHAQRVHIRDASMAPLQSTERRYHSSALRERPPQHMGHKALSWARSWAARGLLLGPHHAPAPSTTQARDDAAAVQWNVGLFRQGSPSVGLIVGQSLPGVTFPSDQGNERAPRASQCVRRRSQQCGRNTPFGRSRGLSTLPGFWRQRKGMRRPFSCDSEKVWLPFDGDVSS
jgi:hypothetical protein